MHALLLGLPLIVAAALPAPDSLSLEQVVALYRPDSLVAPLRRFELQHGRERAGGEAALLLGRLHYARGEYRPAAEAFSRAAARLDSERKDEARYWAGLCWLALEDPSQARAALEEVAAGPSARRQEAWLGVAYAWEMAGRPERAYETLERLLRENPGEAGPAALERLGSLATRFLQPEVAKSAQDRLLREYPSSMEAASAAAPGAHPPAPASPGARSVEIGEFSSLARARAMRNTARQAGFPETEVWVRGEGRSRAYHVRLGVYANAQEARQQGEEAARRLGVRYTLGTP